jgi:hypothetical protein
LSRRIANDCDALRHVARDDRAGSDNGIIADGNARQDNCPTTDPNILPDRNWTAKLGAGFSNGGVARMIGCVYLDRRPDLRSSADRHDGNVKDDAVKV